MIALRSEPGKSQCLKRKLSISFKGDTQSFHLNRPIHHIADLGGKSLKVYKFVQRRHSKPAHF